MAEKMDSPGAGVKAPPSYISEDAKKKLAEAMSGQNPKLKAVLDANKRQMELRKKLADELKNIFDKAEKDSKRFIADISKKYKKEIMGMVIVPPKPPAPGKAPQQKAKTSPELFVILDIKKEGGIRNQIKTATPIFKTIIEKAKKEIPKIKVNPILLDEIWDASLKGHHEILRLIVMGRIVKDDGWLTALKAVELHKTRVVQQLDKYVVSYVIVGSIVNGHIQPESDLDTYVIIDDTDVTKMTSNELLYKLRNMISSMSFEIGNRLGIKNPIHTQVHVLTDVWNLIKNANPVVFTFLRDGIPLYDRGMFTPWKLLLKKGKVTPSPEAIDNYIKSGRIALDRVKLKFKEIAMEDLHWATITPTQGLLMLLGVPPVAPKEISSKLHEYLIKPGLLEEKYVKIWDRLLKVRKDIEHKKLKDIDPKKLIEYVNDAKLYLDRIDKLFKQVEKDDVKSKMFSLYEKTIEDAQLTLKLIGTKAEKKNIVNAIKNELVGKNLAPKRYLDLVQKIIALNESLDTSRQEIATLEFEEERQLKDIIELINTEKGKNIEKYKVMAKYSGETKTANLWFFGDEVHILSNVNKKTTDLKRYKITKSGKIQDPSASSIKLIEKKLATYSGGKANITDDTIKSLKTLLGSDVKLIIG